jgi:ATP-dependent Zn protease
MLIFINLVFWRESPSKRVAYSTFVSQVEAGKVIRAEIGTEKIKYELKVDGNVKQSKVQPKQIYITTAIPNDTELPKILRTHQVEYSASEPNLHVSFLSMNWTLFQVKLPKNMNEWLRTGQFSPDKLLIATTCNGHQK